MKEGFDNKKYVKILILIMYCKKGRDMLEFHCGTAEFQGGKSPRI